MARSHFGVGIDEEMAFDRGVQMVKIVADELIAMVDKRARVEDLIEEERPAQRPRINQEEPGEVKKRCIVEEGLKERRGSRKVLEGKRQEMVECRRVWVGESGTLHIGKRADQARSGVESLKRGRTADRAESVEASIDERTRRGDIAERAVASVDECQTGSVEAGVDECQPSAVEASVDERQAGTVKGSKREKADWAESVKVVEVSKTEKAGRGEEEEETFGYRLSEFPTEKRPIDYEKNWDNETPQQQQDLPLTDLVMHEIPTYRHAKPHCAKSQISAEDEIEWQLTNILRMSGTIIRMGMGLTGAPHTYARLKDITFGPIPDPRGEESLLKKLHRYNKQQGFSGNQRDEEQEELGRMIFEYFFDDYGVFWHSIHFPRMAWASLTLKPSKTRVAVSRISPLGMHVGLSPRVGSYGEVVRGLMASKGKIDKIVNYPIPQTADDIENFLYMTTYLKGLIPGRAEHARIINRSPLKSSKDRWIESMVASWSRGGRNHTDWCEWWETGRQVIRRYYKLDKSREGMPSMHERCSFLEKREDC
ncbi:hypothetical protein BDZ91DRAFT_718035 [Kalaharituber pfeilii]|nr:hypothetical protein BDZ91DRAFT_718035 [Kalaharituber pfeilii]